MEMVSLVTLVMTGVLSMAADAGMTLLSPEIFSDGQNPCDIGQRRKSTLVVYYG